MYVDSHSLGQLALASKRTASEQNEKGRSLYVAVMCLTLPAPRTVIELAKCACKSGCKGRCCCCKNGLPRTPLSKCYVGDCGHLIKNDVHEEEEEADE